MPLKAGTETVGLAESFYPMRKRKQTSAQKPALEVSVSSADPVSSADEPAFYEPAFSAKCSTNGCLRSVTTLAYCALAAG